ncbi:MAG TPA: hypothetical protein VIF88_14425 [Methylocystis sp.]|jgi:hypothetical protein
MNFVTGDRRCAALAAIWISFAVSFFSLASFHYKMADSAMPDFQRPERPQPKGMRNEFRFNGIPLDKPLQDFAETMNTYVHEQNASSKQSNMISFWGYVFAACAAIFSAAAELFPRSKHNAHNVKQSGGDQEKATSLSHP